MLLPAINHKILSGDWTADSVGITHRLPLFQSIMSSRLQKAYRLLNDIGLLSSDSVNDYVGLIGETHFVLMFVRAMCFSIFHLEFSKLPLLDMESMIITANRWRCITCHDMDSTIHLFIFFT